MRYKFLKYGIEPKRLNLKEITKESVLHNYTLRCIIMQ